MWEFYLEDTFERLKRTAECIEGMLSPFSMAVMDSLLEFQERKQIEGNIIEIGVFHGKSAAILAGRMAQSERLILVDIAAYLERDKIPRSDIEFYCCSSKTFPERCPDYPALRRSVRFAHIDASHQFKPTFDELAVCDELLREDGLRAMDDFTNLNYSQIIAAIFKYLFTTSTDLMPVIVTSEKAYLCRRSHFHVYANYALDGIIRDLGRRGIDGCLARTEIDPEYMAYHVREKLPGETDDKYGFSIYKFCYRKTEPLSIPAKSGSGRGLSWLFRGS